MKTIMKISNCQECPFGNSDNEFGTNLCNLSGDIFTENHDELPSDKVHDHCLLKIGDYKIKLNK